MGPFSERFWRSPLRGPWLASILSSALLPLLAVCALTGFLSHLAYQPHLGANAIFNGPGPGNGFDVFGLDWPTNPAWLYAATQGLHVVCGVAAIPILLAKLWTVIPKLFENPPARSVAHALERLSLVLLVGGGLFTIATGVINIQLWYPFGFPFVPAHYYGAMLFVAALAFHVALKVPVMARALSQSGCAAAAAGGPGAHRRRAGPARRAHECARTPRPHRPSPGGRSLAVSARRPSASG